MSSIFRVRPAINKTIDEIEQHYLWFSKPTHFNDVEDANIFAFIKNNESIESAFSRIYQDHHEVAIASSKAGICCFTDQLPLPSRLRRFRKATKGIVIEYDRTILEAHFARTIGLGNCLKKVEYHSNPTLFEADNPFNILWETKGDDKIYKTISSIIREEKTSDELFLKMFTRINTRYADQQEYRIILAGRNIPAAKESAAGYKVNIPPEAIKKIHVHKLAKPKIKAKASKIQGKFIDLSTHNEREQSI